MKGPRPDTRSRAHAALQKRHRLIADLLGGTEAMREAGQRYLPKAEDERASEYESRLLNSFLLPMLEDAICDLTSAPFERELRIEPQPAAGSLDALLELSADGAGVRVNDFAKLLFEDGVTYGAWHVLVDYRGDGSQTAGQEARGEARPYFVRVPPFDILDDRWSADGRLVHFRYREVVDEPDPENPFATVEAQRVVAWDLEEGGELIRITRWREARAKRGDAVWTIEDERVARLPGGQSFGQIPLVSVLFGRANGLAAQPPLIALAWKNVEHWRSSSEQRNALSFTRSGVLVFEGMSQDELEKTPITVGANRALGSQGRVYYAEHAGHGIKAGAEDLAAIERAGAEMGSKPYHERATVDTATGRRIDNNRRLTKVQAWIRGSEIGLRNAWAIAYRWRNLEVSADLTIELFSDFTRGAADTDPAQLIQMRGAGDLTRRTLLVEMKRRGILGDSFDVDAELEELEQETARAVGLDAEGADGDEPDDAPAAQDDGDEPEVDDAEEAA